MGSAPVIIHLLNRQRYRRITWAAMHWLMASLKKSSRRLQIEELILLIVRILVLVLLALALARPFLAESGLLLGGQSRRHRVVILDTSFSMGQVRAGRSLFAGAKEQALQLATTSTLSSGDSVTLVLMTDQARTPITLSSNLVEVAREVEATELSHSATDPARAVAKAFEVLAKDQVNQRKEIFLVTDMTRSGWLEPETGADRVRSVDELNKAVAAFRSANPDRPVPAVTVVDVGHEETGNLAVSALEADVNVVAARSRVVFRAEVVNHSTEPAKGVQVTFRVNGEPVSTATIDEIGGNGKKEETRFFHQFETSGAHWVSVSIGQDDLAVDDVRYMAVPVVSGLRVLAVDGEEKTDPLASETGLLSRVLSVPVTESMAARGVTSPSIIRTMVVPESGLTDTPLDEQDMLVLANVSVLAADKLPQLRRFVQEGGALLIFVGENVDAATYNERLFDAKDAAGQPLPPLLPGRLVEMEGEGGNSDFPTFHAFLPDENMGGVLPTFAREERRSYIGRPKPGAPDVGVRVFRRYRVKVDEPLPAPAENAAGKEPAAAATQPADTGEGGDAVAAAPAETAPAAATAAATAGPERGRVLVPLRYDDGEPAILVREYGLGKVCLVTTTADTWWTDLPAKWVSVPFMHDLVYHLVQERGRRHNLPVGGNFVVKWPAEDLLKDVVVQPPEGHEDDKCTLRPASIDGVITISYNGPLDAGANVGARWAGPYRLSVAGSDELRHIFAVNLDPAESDLERIGLDRIGKLVESVAFEAVPRGAGLAEFLRGRHSGQEFWRNLMWTVLCLALAETFLAWLFGRNRW